MRKSGRRDKVPVKCLLTAKDDDEGNEILSVLLECYYIIVTKRCSAASEIYFSIFGAHRVIRVNNEIARGEASRDTAIARISGN